MHGSNSTISSDGEDPAATEASTLTDTRKHRCFCRSFIEEEYYVDLSLIRPSRPGAAVFLLASVAVK